MTAQRPQVEGSIEHLTSHRSSRRVHTNLSFRPLVQVCFNKSQVWNLQHSVVTTSTFPIHTLGLLAKHGILRTPKTMKFTQAIAAACLLAVAAAVPTHTHKHKRADSCGQYDSVQTGSYTVYNNLWGEASASSGSECFGVDGLSGNTVSWHTRYVEALTEKPAEQQLMRTKLVLGGRHG